MRVLELIVRLVGGIALLFTGWAAAEAFFAEWLGLPPTQLAVFLALVGFLFGALIAPNVTIRPLFWAIEQARRLSAPEFFAATIGLLVGLALAALLAVPLSFLPGLLGQIMPVVGLLMLTYAAITLAVQRRSDLFGLFGFLRRSEAKEEKPDAETPSLDGAPVLLDTSAIVDGRIGDISRTGFLPGPLVVPGFVLAELQRIADSAEPIKRSRGRHGLEVLNRMRKESAVPFRVYDAEVNGVSTVDAKLVQLAREHRWPILTNDFNLNRVAALQGVRVLNVNELANAVRTPVLPGEVLTICIVQEGREPSQGVGYLEDGTMVVVEGGRSYRHRDVEVIVSRVIQTAAGRMIFAHLKSE